MFKNRLNNLSIKWKIFAYLIGFCGFLLIMLWLFQIVFLDSFYKFIKIKNAEKTSSVITKNINSDNIEEIVSSISKSMDLCISVVSSDGQELYRSDIMRECIIHKINASQKAEIYQKTLSQNGELLEYYSPENIIEKDIPENNQSLPPNFENSSRPFGRKAPNSTILYSKIISMSDGKNVMILINSMISPVDATVNTLMIQLYVITGVMILFSVILAFIISKKVSKPIENINNSAKILSDGNYNVQFDGKGYKEISELSQTLNYTAKELSQVENLRKELMANISHDLRTPLTLIGGYAEAMRDLPDENTPENAQIIIDETSRLTSLVNDVLDISKYESGVQTLKYSSFNITSEFLNICSNMQKLLNKEGYSINFEYDKEVILKADITRLCQAFYNLLVNAVNYTGEDKNIFIRQITEKDEVIFKITDTGKGISKENIKYIWDRYYKTDKNHKRAVTGTGLGLSIVKSIIQLHGGQYGVISEENKGSTFWFSLKLF